MGKIRVKEKKEREESLKIWLKQLDKDLEDWINSLPLKFQNKMDYSLESLVDLADYLISKYHDVSDAYSLSNSREMVRVSGYIGEVYLRNLPKGNSWLISEKEPVTKGTKFEFFFLVGKDGGGMNPFHGHVPYIINTKDKMRLFNSFRVKRNLAISEEKEEKTAEVPGKGGFSYQYFILVKDESFELKEIEQALKAYYAKKGSEDKVHFHNERHLLVNMGDDYYFHFQLDTSEGVLQESKEIAKNYKGDKDKPVIASCRSRVEFWGDEDLNGDYINDHMYLLEQLLQNDKLLIFDFRNGVFFG